MSDAGNALFMVDRTGYRTKKKRKSGRDKKRILVRSFRRELVLALAYASSQSKAERVGHWFEKLIAKSLNMLNQRGAISVYEYAVAEKRSPN